MLVTIIIAVYLVGFVISMLIARLLMRKTEYFEHDGMMLALFATTWPVGIPFLALVIPLTELCEWLSKKFLEEKNEDKDQKGV